MKITINGKPADITLEAEKTVGDVMAGIQQWLESSPATASFSVSGFDIDGKTAETLSLSAAFDLPLETVSVLNITTSSWADLMLEALYRLKNGLEGCQAFTKEQRQMYCHDWSQSASGRFIQSQQPALYQTITTGMENETTAVALSASIEIVSQQIREIEAPSRELAAVLPLMEEIAKRLEDMPLDMQTGKDARAAETIALFSALMEKIFRLIVLFGHFGTNFEHIQADSIDETATQPLPAFIADFNAALNELLAAYENNDTVLVGDLAEYELAPRFRRLALVLSALEQGSNTQ